MLLWTIQHKAAYDEMISTGTLVANEDYLFLPEDDRESYVWLSKRMVELIGEPPLGTNFPVWAWYQWEGKRKRPDMRTHRFCREKGSPIVLLTVEIPDDKVLLSDFDMWHCVLNDCYLPLDEEDDKEIYTDEEKIASWDNVFRYDVINDYWDNPKSIQATMWEIKKEWIVKAEHFIAG